MLVLRSSPSSIISLSVSCSKSSQSTAPNCILGSGAGGGPLASRLALAGFKGTDIAFPLGVSNRFSVLVVEHGHDVNNLNTTIPLYLARSNDGWFFTRYLWSTF